MSHSRSQTGMLGQFAGWLACGRKTPSDLRQICLRRISETDQQIQAWVEVSPQEPLAAGPLRGIPFGVKDIFETRGMATEFGSPLYAGRQGATDAAIVTELRRLGAVLLGKTHTAAFAYLDPAPTRNPHDLERTPGGSSSGSAAAIAAGMVPFALGTQTQGSVLRPASFCGVAGFKPTFGLIPMDGVLPFAPSLDTVGFFTSTADDMRMLWRILHPDDPPSTPCAPWACAIFGSPERIMEQAFQAQVAQLCAQGLAVHRVDLPEGFDAVTAAARLINDYEGAHTHRQRWKEHGTKLGCKLAQLVETGMAIPQERYLAALDTVNAMRLRMSEFFREHPVVLTPAAPGPAPLGLTSTGDPRMNAPWTALGVPAISIPMPVPGLPLGMQITAPPGCDSQLLEAATAVERLWQT